MAERAGQHGEGAAHPASLEDTGTAAFPLSARIEPKEGEVVTSSYAVAPGAVLAQKYKVIRTIGQGGMGIVVAARHLQLDIPVAMKLLNPEHVGSEEALGRFLREARAATKLMSEHVTRVLDVGTLPSGEPYMVMEYLAGEDLAYHVRTHALGVSDVVDYIAQACCGIAEAHAAGIIHRDLKPANLFLTTRPGGGPLVKVLDFGVSKVTEEHGEVHLTQTQTILGSALYMSPEQMRSSKDVDQRTDIYALGVCLYELLSGEPPFFAESFPELCAMVLTRDPAPLRERRPDVSEGLWDVIARALKREPGERYQRVVDLMQALSPFATDAARVRITGHLADYAPELDLLPRERDTVPAPPEKPPTKRGLLVAVAAVALVAGAAVAAGVGLRGSPAATSPHDAPITAFTPPPAPPKHHRAPAKAARTAATTRPAATAALPLPSAPSATASAAASTAGSAPEATRPKSTASARASAGPPRPIAPLHVDKPEPAPLPTQSRDLMQETCTQTLPDGTRKVVPCGQ